MFIYLFILRRFGDIFSSAGSLLRPRSIPRTPAPSLCCLHLALTFYSRKCSTLQEKPNPLACSRLLLTDRESNVAVKYATAAVNDTASVSDTAVVRPTEGDDSDDGRRGSSTAADRRQDRSMLNLSACRLTDREFQVLLHALSQRGAGRDLSAGPSPMHFGTLLLSENPGIGAGAIGALCGSGSSNCSSNNPKGLFPFLVRLDLSRCGLTAADLAGFLAVSHRHSSAGGVDTDSGGGITALAPPLLPASESLCLRELVLRDNPLTRVGVIGGGQGSESWMDPAQRGTAALREVIARAPELELLDISGGSTLARCFTAIATCGCVRTDTC